MSSNFLRWVGVATALSATAVVLTGCSDSEADSGTEESTSNAVSLPAGGERLLTAGEAGVDRAGSFGFSQSAFVTEEAIDQFRESMENSLAEGGEEAQVEPANCAEPLAAVDWAPLLLDADVMRADFVAESFTGTGSLEIADVSDDASADRVQQHIEHVLELTTSCPSVEFSQGGATYALEVSQVDLSEFDELNQAEDSESFHDEAETTSATVGYRWVRSFASDDSGDSDDANGADSEDEAVASGTTVAQILFTQSKDDVVMVSFIGEEAAGSQEFTEISAAITTQALDALE